jgi:hypothetical protein
MHYQPASGIASAQFPGTLLRVVFMVNNLDSIAAEKISTLACAPYG